MRKVIIAIASMFIVAIVGLAIGSPYWAAHELEDAARRGDADKIEMLTDMPAIRDGLKSQISTALMQKLNSDPDTKGNLFGAFGALIAPVLIDKAIDAYVTPEGIANILKSGKPVAQTSDPADQSPRYTAEREYLGIDRFCVRLHDKNSDRQGPALVFERRGFLTWKLVQIELPPDSFKDRLLPGSSASDQPPE